MKVKTLRKKICSNIERINNIKRATVTLLTSLFNTDSLRVDWVGRKVTFAIGRDGISIWTNGEYAIHPWNTKPRISNKKIEGSHVPFIINLKIVFEEVSNLYKKNTKLMDEMTTSSIDEYFADVKDLPGFKVTSSYHNMMVETDDTIISVSPESINYTQRKHWEEDKERDILIPIFEKVKKEVYIYPCH